MLSIVLLATTPAEPSIDTSIGLGECSGEVGKVVVSILEHR